MQSHSPIWTLIEEVDPMPLKAAEAAEASDVNFWSCGLHPVTQSTPLQLVVPRVAQYGVDESSLKQFLHATEWMIERGADPHAVAPASCTGVVSLRFEAKESFVEVGHAGKSALSLAVAVRAAMRASQLNRQRPEDYDWTDAMEVLTRLIELFCSVQRAVVERVSVDVSVINMWSRVASAAETHDVEILISSGKVTAHCAVLSAVSPVLSRMLGSEWCREGQLKKIELQETPLSALRLFIDLVYTGSTYEIFPVETALAAFELAHRWQCDGVVNMLERALCRMICEESFEAIATHAVRFELSLLIAACTKFATDSQPIRSQLAKGLLPPALVAMLQGSEGRPPRKKRRRAF
ncbi:hypothetical protein AB1Y20_020674 [Prymnesium parvum]|uniref:BTB domain-containing protein n=1 Tax=Prymnesium parvum TaxID=97485 RepID=A0AB34JUB0_PRYPA